MNTTNRRDDVSIDINDLARITGNDAAELQRAFDEAPPPLQRPSATVLPFPVRRRQGWTAKLRAQAARFPRRRDEWLQAQVDVYRQRLIDIGVDQAHADAEARDLDGML